MRKVLYVIISILLALSLAACGQQATTKAPQTEAEIEAPAAGSADNLEEADGSEESVESGTPISVTHELGTTELVSDPSRIVVFDYGTLDILDHVGIDIVGLGVGGSLPAHLSTYGDENKYIVSGSLHEPDFETVFELEPDLILIGGRAAAAYDELSTIAPVVYLPLPGAEYLETFEKNISTLSQIFPAQAGILDSKLDSAKSAISELHSEISNTNPTALAVLVNEGNLSVFGNGSRFAVLYEDFGFELIDPTIEESTHGQSASFEYVLEQNPDYIFVVDRGAATGSEGADSAAAVMDNDLINQTDAAINGQIIYLDPTNWYTASGGIYSTEVMISEIADIIK